MKKVAFYTLGCKVNQYETQAMRGLFEKAGYETCSFHEKADVYVINSCTVTGTGDKKSRQAVHRAKRANPEGVVALVGCYAQHLTPAEKETIGADVVLGTGVKDKICAMVEKALSEKKRQVWVEDIGGHRVFEEMPLVTYEGRTRAVLKIQDGCDRYCSYCIIPYVRGPVRSRGLEEIRKEARRLAEAGFCEIVLAGIQVAAYGKDRGEGGLDSVIACVAETEGIRRIRLSSLEQPAISEEFLRKGKETGKLCPSFHLSLQSGSDSVLKRMNRRYTCAEYLQTVELVRSYFPDAGITTDVIVGFPGETEEEFEQTMDFIQKVGFSQVHVFPYSPREGTKAAQMPDQVDGAVKEKRMERMLALTKDLHWAFVRRMLGRSYEVLFERINEEGMWEGFTPNYIHVAVKSSEPLAGVIREVVLTEENTGLEEKR